MLDKLKNSRFISIVCHQINQMPPLIVGLLTLLIYTIGGFTLLLLASAASIIALLELVRIAVPKAYVCVKNDLAQMGMVSIK